MKPTLIAVVAALGMSACVASPNIPDYQRASVKPVDYRHLDCDQLTRGGADVAEASSPTGVFTFRPGWENGAPVAERTAGLVDPTQEEIRLRKLRDCEAQASATPEPAKAAPREPAPRTVAAAPAHVTPKKTGKAKFNGADARRGRFLQVATFSSRENRDATIEAFRARGVMASAQPLSRNGREMHRILIGPLRSRADLLRADKAAGELGLNDGFIVDG
ncbi:MAG: SPOR domain-containing protein [Pseudomonadota bacterium]